MQTAPFFLHGISCFSDFLQVTTMDKKMYLSFVAALATIGAVCLFALLAAPIARPLA
jgi:hypothetical protein